MSPILVTLTSSSAYNFERSNISLKENIPDGVDPNSDGHGYCVRKNEGKILWFSADHYLFYSFGMPFAIDMWHYYTSLETPAI